MSIDLTPVLVAVVGAAGMITAAWLTGGRHAKEIRRQITPRDPNKTFAGELADHSRELAAIARAVGVQGQQIHDHVGDELRHTRPPARGVHQ